MGHNSYPLQSLLQQSNQEFGAPDEKALDLFLNYVQSTGLSLYQAQEEALMELVVGHNVILNTPTGSGKSLVALFVHFLSLWKKRKSVYTAPIKALVNEKFLSLCHLFGPDQVGLMTGDASVNTGAPLLCCTAEILANMALRCFEETDVHDVVIDEFHYFSDRERGTAWQVPLLTLPHARFLLMSATLGDPTPFEKSLTQLTGIQTVTVTSVERPVPLDFRYEEIPLEILLEQLVLGNKSPVYLVHFTQNECATTAQSLLSVNYTTKEEKQKIQKWLEGEDFRTPYGKDLKRLLLHGIGIHHAGLLPKYRVLVEKLAKEGLLKIICGTDTLGVGVNIPIRTVLLTKLCKFDGEKTTLLSARDFHQIAGRAGRRGYDTEGSVVVMAPGHVIENKKKEEKNKGPQGKNKKVVKAKAPEKGFIPWDKQTFERLRQSQAEALKSSFKVSHGLILNILSGPRGLRRLKRLVESSFESETQKRKHKQESLVLLRSLLQQRVIEFIPAAERVVLGPQRMLRVNADLQEDFSLMNSLSLYFLDTLDRIDPYLEDYPLRVLTLAESILENPAIILRRQVDKLKTQLMGELKSEGVEYEERLERLEEVDYPRPMKETLYETFNEFSKKHPWVGQENIRPKSIAREMIENFYSFNDYIREYGLERSEGVLLRHLMEVYKVLNQTLPEKLKNEKVMDMILYVESLIREVDAGILDEWNRMKDPVAFMEATLRGQEVAKAKEKAQQEEKSFEIMVLNGIFHVIKALAFDRWERVLEILEVSPNPHEVWTSERLEKMMEPYWQEFAQIELGPQARQRKHIQILREGDWTVKHRLLDPEGESGFYLVFRVDREKSKTLGRPVLFLVGLETV